MCGRIRRLYEVITEDDTVLNTAGATWQVHQNISMGIQTERKTCARLH